MADGYLYSQDFWFHILFLFAFISPLIIIVIATVTWTVIKKLTKVIGKYVSGYK